MDVQREFCDSVHGNLGDRLGNFEDVALEFRNENDFSYAEDHFMQSFTFTIKDRTGRYFFWITQFMENGIPNSDIQASVSGPYANQTAGYLAEVCVWMDFERDNSTYKREVNELEEDIYPDIKKRLSELD